MERHVVSTASGGASITSRFLTLGRSFSISALTGKYSPHRTGVPRIFFFSKTFTFKPFFDRWTAAERPPGPPPTMTTSYLLPSNWKRKNGRHMESDHGRRKRLPEKTVPNHWDHCSNHRGRYPRSVQRNIHREL